MIRTPMSVMLAALAAAAASPAAGAGDGTPIRLTIDGDGAYTARCTLTDVDGRTHTIALDGEPPLARTFHGRRLHCAVEVTTPGGVTVTMTSNGNRARSRASGAGSRIVLAQGG